MRFQLGLILCLFLSVGCSKSVSALEPVATWTKAEFANVMKVVPPATDEDAFEQIPWQISLWEARKLAAAQGKPILLWEMDGHPLGCG